MEQYGKTLAATHKMTSRRTRDPLLARLADNESTLVEVCNLLTESLYRSTSASRRPANG